MQPGRLLPGVVQLLAGGEDLRRRALESLALEELRAGRISEAQLAQMLGLDRMEVDGFLKAHGVYYDFTVEEIEEQVNLTAEEKRAIVAFVHALTGSVREGWR